MEKSKIGSFIVLLFFFSCNSVHSSSFTCTGCADCNDKISSASAGDVILLSANVSASGTCIEMNDKTGLTFNCQNNVIWGDSTGYGLQIYGGSSNTVTNCSIVQCNYGIKIDSSDNNLIKRNTFSVNAMNGIYVISSLNNTFINNSASSNEVNGLFLQYSNRTTISGNTIKDGRYGIQLYMSGDNTLSGNNVTGNENGIWFVYSSGNDADNNRACNNSDNDFYMSGTSSDTGTGNTCDLPDGWNDTGKTGCSYGCSVVTTTTTTTTSSTSTTTPTCNSCANCNALIKTASPDSRIALASSIANQATTCINFNKTVNITLDCQGNSITGTRASSTYGVLFNQSYGCTVINCQIMKFYYGVYIYYSNETLVIGNTIANSSMDGVYSYYSRNISIGDNMIDSNGWIGLNIQYSNEGQLSDNRVRNQSYGVVLTGSNGFGLYYNNASGNSLVGLHIDAGSGQNTLTENTFCLNGVKDINNSRLVGNTGNGNTCDNADGWNDTGKTGCSLACSSVTTTTTSTTSSTTTTLTNACNSCASCDNLIRDAAPGDTVYLASNITGYAGNCIHVDKKRDVSFDCQGNSIRGNGTDIGLTLNYSSGCAAKNCIISKFNFGLLVYFSNWSSVSGNTLDNNTLVGMFSMNSSGSMISGNSAKYNGNHGCYLYCSNNNQLTVNAFDFNVLNGINMYDSRNNTFAGNVANNNSEGIHTGYFSISNNISSNTFCFNKKTDFNTTGSGINNGTSNACNLPDGWNDIGKTGCSLTCSSVTTTTASTTSTSTSTTSVSSTTILSSRVSVSRDLPLSASPGSKVTVRLTMDVNESDKPISVGITEYFPQGWTVNGITQGGIEKTSPARIEWLFWPDGYQVRDQVINYTIWAPSNQNGTYNFTGSVETESENLIGITGDYRIRVGESCTLSGDDPPCGEITLSEVVALINLWSKGDAKLSDVIVLINAWSGQ